MTIETKSVSLDDLAIRRDRRKSDFQKAYIRLVEAAALKPALSDAQADELDGVLDGLNLTFEDFKNDATARREYDAAEKTIVDFAAIQRLIQAQESAGEELRRIDADYQKARFAALSSLNEANAARNNADDRNRQTRDERHRLKESNPRAFGDFAPKGEPEIKQMLRSAI